ncbi:MAG: LytTR family transcriptional regulator [Arcicella sp.]|jgi:two-component system LytT family response regulator|nr:LytTR family transcriptional regulator [Arcicella sp.]
MKTYQSTHNPNRVVLNSKTRLSVPVNLIVLLKGQANYTTFILTDGSKRVVAHTLKYFEAFLQTHGFQRVDRSSLVNPHFIQSYHQSSALVMMKNGMVVKVSRRRRGILSLQGGVVD